MKLTIRIWRETLKILAENPVIWVPFFIVGLFDAISLILIYLAPQPPLSAILAPVIRAFWGEQYLHYPLNLLLIPRLFGYAHIVTTAIIGVLMTGLAIGTLKEVKEQTRPQILFNFILALKRYFTLLAIWLIMFILATPVYKIPHFFLTHNNRVILQIAFYLSFLIVILIQVAFIYAIPAAFIERRGVISAVKRGLPLSRRHFLATLMLVMVPALFYIPITILKGKSAVLMSRFFPEIVLIIVGLGIVVSVLIDCLVTCSATILFLNQRRA